MYLLVLVINIIAVFARPTSRKFHGVRLSSVLDGKCLAAPLPLTPGGGVSTVECNVTSSKWQLKWDFAGEEQQMNVFVNGHSTWVLTAGNLYQYGGDQIYVHPPNTTLSRQQNWWVSPGGQMALYNTGLCMYEEAEGIPLGPVTGVCNPGQVRETWKVMLH
ncbi:hypothetical protein M231_03783 [Tremella mesenterica]|uniref:Uncharacterized protein n=1 Tax=Tremella mesenterica TaxID=5217 RepID=A0A4Q1BM92_TREME|nr:hypothetical protein M231_03783 [Tremella mesenterica]